MAQLYQTVLSFTDFLLRYFIVLAAVGSLAMALLELWKKITSTELRYHARALCDWFGRDDKALGDLIHLGVSIPQHHAEATAKALIGNHGAARVKLRGQLPPEYALFALPLERMIAHMHNAADVALRNPARYQSLFHFLASGAHDEDLKIWVASVQPLDPAKPRDPAFLSERADLYSRLQLAIRQKVAAFELYTDQRWVNHNQRRANVVGVVILGAMVFWNKELLDPSGTFSNLTLLAACLGGGILAPIAKDFVVALNKVRER